MSLIESIVLFYQKTLPEPMAGLISGMVLGQKKAIISPFWEDLKLTGLAHVVVASGSNISLLASFVLPILLILLKRKYAVVFTCLFIWGYVFLIGMDPPIVRAGIMASIIFMGEILGKTSNTVRILVITGIIMILVKPVWLKDLSFQLSFASTLGIVLFEEKIRKRLEFLPDIFKQSLSTSLSAQILVDPILYFTFGYISILSPIINMLVLWTVPIITVIGMISGLISLLSKQLAVLVLYLAYPVLWFFVYVTETFSRYIAF